MAECLIRFDGVSKSYSLPNGQANTILNNLSMELPRANIGILGRNGAGKSTLIRMMSGIENPDRGKIRRYTKLSWPLGFRGSFHRELTGIENIRFVARIYGRDSNSIIEEVKEFAELGDSFNAPVKTYSSGMAGRLAFGLSMAIAFDCYLIDEVMAVGDASFKKKSKRIFQEKLKDSNIIMVSHSMSTLREFCDSGILLDNGKLKYFEDINDAITLYQEINNLPENPENRKKQRRKKQRNKMKRGLRPRMQQNALNE